MIFYYPNTINWWYHLQRPQQILKALARLGHKCYFVNKIVNLPGCVNPHKVVKESEKLYIVPPTLEMAFDFDVLYYTFPPSGRPVLKQKNPEIVIFDVIDEPEGIFEFWNIGNAWNNAVGNADIVLASARSLYRKAKQYNDNVHMVPNGVEYGLFSATWPMPEEMADLKGPIVGYSGMIATWVDLELIEYAASQLPDYNFVLLGSEMNAQLETDLDNIHKLGHVNYERVPAFVSNFDVCILPFRINDPVIKGTNPIKLWEYLATGKPVISTNIPEAQGLRGVKTTTSSNDFIREIYYAIAGDPPYYQHLRRELAQKNTWDVRAETILAAIDEFKVNNG